MYNKIHGWFLKGNGLMKKQGNYGNMGGGIIRSLGHIVFKKILILIENDDSGNVHRCSMATCSSYRHFFGGQEVHGENFLKI